MKNNKLKILPEYFSEVAQGNKYSELRFDDRDFKVGDVYELCEYIPSKKRFTGRKIKIVITYVLKGFEGLKEGWCMFSFRRVDEIEEFRIDYEAEYHRCVGTMSRIHNEREENKSTIVALLKVISEQCIRIADLEQRIEDEYWKRRDGK